MKNRKLFAIITLVAFMLTMMPVMAFGATTATTATGSWVELDKHYVDLTTDAGNPNQISGDIHLDGATLGGNTIVVAAINDDGSINKNVIVGISNDGWNTNNPGLNTATANVATFSVYSAVKTTATIKVYLADGDTIKDTTSAFALEQMIKKGYVISDGTEVGYIKEITADGSMKVTFGSATGDITMSGTFTPVANGTSGTAVTVEDMTGADTVTPGVAAVSANNGIDVYNVRLTLSTDTGKLVNTPVTVSFNKVGAYINETELVTNAGGVVSFKVYANRGDDYVMNVAASNFSQDVKLTFSDIAAAKAEFVNVTTDTIASGEAEAVVATIKSVDSLGNSVDYSNTFLDIEVVAAPELSSLKGLKESDSDAKLSVTAANKVKFQPDVPGAYTLKVYNKTTGVSDTCVVNAAKFGTVDHITVSYGFDSYALKESTGAATVKGYDKDGVVKTVTGSSFSYAGVGVKSFNNTTGAITFESAAAYAGQQIVVTAVYNNKFMASTTLTIGVQPASINFTEATGKAGTEVTVTGQLVDLNGDAVAPSNGATISSTAIVIAKPEGALAYADATQVSSTSSDVDFKNKGIAKVKITSNKEGIVKVNVITTITTTIGGSANTYYVAGTATVNFGGVATVDTIPDSIVNMIIGANTVIADGKASASPVAPFIENGRTFVPVRAFAEATGATVNYDAATQVITIKAKGVDAQMTVGSNVMTVNGETVVMDAAARVIGEGYTVLPVRYAGQALGYSFDVAYGANGAVTAVTMTK